MLERISANYPGYDVTVSLQACLAHSKAAAGAKRDRDLEEYMGRITKIQEHGRQNTIKHLERFGLSMHRYATRKSAK